MPRLRPPKQQVNDPQKPFDSDMLKPKEEDVWQGKVGLVLKAGPNAFVNPDDGSLYEQRVDVGDWVVFKVGDGWQLEVNRMPCRSIKDTNFIAKIKDPMMVL